MKTVLWSILLLSSAALSQFNINGVIQDSLSGKPLPSANVQIQATYRGAVSNPDGRFQLRSESWPVTLRISHIGYQSQTLTLLLPAAQPIVIALQPSVIKMPDMVITAEDPAFNIMRKVIAAKKKQRESLRRFTADAYSRLRAENDSSVVMISESTSHLYWDREKGIAEKIVARVQTLNLEKGMNAPHAGHLPNLNDDNISQYGFTLIGPTHPQALDYYDFKLENRRSQDGKIVYDIDLTPKSKLQPSFSGSISILDEAYALLEADLTACNIHPQEFYLQKLEFACRQQFSRFDSLYWLPTACRQRDLLRFGIPGLQFPTVKVVRFSSLDNYKINPAIPDSVFTSHRGPAAAIQEAPADSMLTFRHRQVPLTLEEERAYTTIDSTMTVLKGFQPKGYLARFVKVEAKTDTQAQTSHVTAHMPMQLAPILGFNRVDGLQTGLTYRLAFLACELNLQGRYHWSARRWASAAEWRYHSKGHHQWNLGLRFVDQSQPIGNETLYPQLLTAGVALLGQSDYFDYFWNREYTASLGRVWRRSRLGVTMAARSSQHNSLTKKTDYSILNRSAMKRENPAIDPGRLNSISVRCNWGEQENTLGMAGQTGLSLFVEHSAAAWGSDFSFTRYEGRMDIHLKTWYTRYLFPNSLDIRMLAGRCAGKRPAQLLGILDSRLAVLAPFGALKSCGDQPLYGDRYVALFAEHNFRGMLWQWLGLESLAAKGVHVLLHGGVGRTWLPDALASWPGLNQWHTEAGFSINGILTYVRCDFTIRLTGSKAFFITLAPRKLF